MNCKEFSDLGIGVKVKLPNDLRAECTLYLLNDTQVTLLEGNIKWDGCSNWLFNKEWIHFCSAEELKTFSLHCLGNEVLFLTYKFVSELCPDWDLIDQE